ncbi:Uma2 family endonuclease [uncultured Microscilla sp.]|uniref:Uma2 family endonuclease n=1 Tax=uncultured Microscilla sp. TaxID=432653 RepID=UPI00260A140E|nr:Uma2 family endonuclease [uncultured Microscilla sp.]
MSAKLAVGVKCYEEFYVYLTKANIMGQAKPQQTHYSYSEYLDLEQTDGIRYEYYHGEVFAMSGGTINHNQISINTQRAIDDVMPDDCRAFIGDIKVEILPNAHYVYPDVVYTCASEDLDDGQDHKITSPSLVVEVLSKSTRQYDKDQKQNTYMRIPSLRYYVLIDQYKYFVEAYERQEGFWKYTTYQQPEDVIALAQLNLHLTVKDIYRKVKF